MRNTARARTTVVFVIVLIGVVGVTPAAADELRWESEITYSADLEDGLLHLSSDTHLTALKPDSRSGNTITSYYFDEIEMYVPEYARNVKITSGSRELDFTIDPISDLDYDGFSLLTVELGRRLFYKQSMDVRIEYDIPGDAPRTDSTFRVNPAYLSFGAWGWGDPGYISLNVVVPEEFSVDLSETEYSESTAEGVTTYSITDIEDPENFYIYVQGYNDDALWSEFAGLDDHDVLIRSWPDDTKWAREVREAVETGLPELQALVGLEWRPDITLEIIESQDVSLAGYGGWYLEDLEVIEIGEWVDPHLVLHELSHTWFNDDLFKERWITEGLADEFSGMAADNTNLANPLDIWIEDVPNRTGSRMWLNDWVIPDLDDPNIDVYEGYGYDTSFWVIHELSEEIGSENLSAVIQAAMFDEIAYRGEPDPERVDEDDDWRRLIDLLEEVGGSNRAPALFEEYVTDEDLSARSAARGEYADLLAQDEGWDAPYYVREPMGTWKFEIATERIGEASAILRTHDRITSNAELISATVPDSLEILYEASTEELDEARAHAAALLTTSNEVVDAKATVDAERGLLTSIGLIGEDTDRELAEAVNAFSDDDLEDASQEAQEVTALIVDAEDVGTTRVLIVVGSLLLIILMIAALVVWRRRRAATGNLQTTDSLDTREAGPVNSSGGPADTAL